MKDQLYYCIYIKKNLSIHDFGIYRVSCNQFAQGYQIIHIFSHLYNLEWYCSTLPLNFSSFFLGLFCFYLNVIALELVFFKIPVCAYFNFPTFTLFCSSWLNLLLDLSIHSTSHSIYSHLILIQTVILSVNNNSFALFLLDW